MDGKELLKILGSEFWPRLRHEGFRGSGTTLRRRIGPVIHVFNIQRSTRGTGFYINLGAHLDFLGSTGMLTPCPPLLKHPDCVFRQRLVSPLCEVGGLWPYSQEAAALLSAISEAWQESGAEFFRPFMEWPGHFADLVRRELVELGPGRMPFVMAQIAAKLGMSSEARQIAKSGIEESNPQAKSYRGSIRKFLRTLEPVSSPSDTP